MAQLRLLEHEYDEVARLVDGLVELGTHDDECECDCGAPYVGTTTSRDRVTTLVERVGQIYDAARARA